MSAVNSIPADETEEHLIQLALSALSQCRWIVGECASKWTQRYAKGRTDADFGNLVGLSGDQVFQRRRVWDSFSDVRQNFPNLKWSHFYLALNWDDAADCLQWAEETQATIAEMRAWRRAQRGEDLTQAPDEIDVPVSFVSGELSFVQDPDSFMPSGENIPRRPFGATGLPTEVDSTTVAALSRELDPTGDNYAPFHSGAVQAPPKEISEKNPTAEAITPEQLAKRLCSTIERCNKALNDDVMEQFEQLPPKLSKRLIEAVEELHSKLAAVKATL